ncbi:MAG: hypothetical protein JXA28_03080, partial [Bacteroidetes bacterium]|nr:hypothetical protein [Bacteroidota bacterium]
MSMKRLITTRFTGIAVMGLVAAAVMLFLPERPPAWEQTLDDITAWHNDNIRSKSGAAKHAVGIRFYYMTRAYGSKVNNIDRAQLDAYLEVESRLGKGLDKASMANDWKLVGPSNWAGRIRAIAFHPNDYNIVYAGAASGGVFKSEAGGMDGSWRPVMDFAEAIPVGALAIDPANPNTVYAGTGEPTKENDRYRGAPLYSGVGIMKTEDGGENWRLLPWPTNSSSVHRLIVHPQNSNVVLAATRGGLYRSADGGENWTRPQPGIITDVELKPDNPDFVYAAMGNDAGTRINGIYFSTNGGETFGRDKLDSNWPSGDSIGRIEMAVTPANPNLVVAFLLKSEKVWRGGDEDFFCIMRSTDAGQNWERLTSLPTTMTSGQGYYDLCGA